MTPAITAALEKIRSPGRRRPPDAEARIWPAWVVVSVWASKVCSWETVGDPAHPARGPLPVSLDQPPIASTAF